MKSIHVFYVFSPLNVNLNSAPSGTFSILCILIFLLCFLFSLVLSTLHLKTSFSLIGTRGISLSFAVLFPASFFLWSPFCLCCFLTLPILDFSPPFFFFWYSSWCSLFILPAKLTEALLLGRCWQMAAGLFGGLYQVGTPRKESFGSLATLLAGVMLLHLGLYT